MKNQYVVIGGIVSVIAAYMYYSRKTKAAQQQVDTNPNASTDLNIGSLMTNSAYQGVTGPNGDNVTGNYRYSEYQSYLNQGGTASGASFDQFLTAAQGNSLPLNS